MSTIIIVILLTALNVAISSDVDKLGYTNSSRNVSVQDLRKSADFDSVSKAAKAGQWRKADLTNYVSYPDPDSEECIENSGCKYAGYFAFVSGKKSENWVRDHHIIAVHYKDAQRYKLKKFRLRQGGREIDATVYDKCEDYDCKGCCTKNIKNTGFLIDIEKFTMQKFGSGSGIVDWKCLNC